MTHEKTYMDIVLKDITRNKILDAILNSEQFKELRDSRDIQAEIEFYGYQERETDAELENLDEFFNLNIEDILKITPIWEWIKESIQDDVSDFLYNTETFLKEGLGYKIQKAVDNKLDSLSNELGMILRARIDAKWQGLTPESAKPRLIKDHVYIAILDTGGKLTREPYPITTNTNAKVTPSIIEEEIVDRFMQEKRKERKLQVEIEPPIKTSHTSYSKRSVATLRKNEVSSVVIVT